MSIPGNLRPATTSLIGRETEVGEIHAAIKAHRLATLTGVGGVGKTRLALEVAARLADEFPDGVWFFELAAVTDPTAVPDAVAAVLGITQQPGHNREPRVGGRRPGGQAAVVGVGQLRARAGRVADLIEAILAASATVTIVATSREGLGIADERLWPVPSLDVGAGVDSAAVALFVERAQNVSPRFTLGGAGEAAAVVEICGRLDGIPLAIELAASRMAAMTAGEVSDRLDQRFRLLVGSRRALERHHTLRHAVAWSYDLLDDAEKALLDRCSVFAGGFDLQSACAVAGFPDPPDDFATLDLLDALVRKSLLVADRSAGRTRFSMLESIRQFAEEQLVARGEASEIRTAHSRYFAGREADIMARWDSPRQRQTNDWFTIELPNLRTAFRWAADHGDLDVAATLATYAGLLGALVQTLEPIAWAEELIEPARAVDHPRLAFLYVIASMCYRTGRIEAAVRYAEAGEIVLGRSREALPYGIEAVLGAVYLTIGQPERLAEVCRAQLARRRDTHVYIRSWLVAALALAGSGGEAMDSADGLIEAAEETGNPSVLAFALAAYGGAFRDADPVAALNALGRGLVIAQDSGNRAYASVLANNLARLRGRARRHAGGARSPHSVNPQLPQCGRHHHDPRPAGHPRRSFRPARTLRTGGHRRRVRAQSHRRGGGPQNHHRDHPPPRCARRGDLRIARPQGRDDDHRRHRDVHLRPNRPGPNRTRTPVLSCVSRVSNARAAQHVLNVRHRSVGCDILLRCPLLRV